MTAELEVSLNGVDLIFSKEYYLLPDSNGFLRVVLKFPKPKAQEQSLLDRLHLFVTGRWAELALPREPYPDLVVINNWAAGWRQMVIFGSKEFNDFVCYQEDVESVQE